MFASVIHQYYSAVMMVTGYTGTVTVYGTRGVFSYFVPLYNANPYSHKRMLNG